MHMCSLAWAQLFFHSYANLWDGTTHNGLCLSTSATSVNITPCEDLPRGQRKVDRPSLRASSQVALGYVKSTKLSVLSQFRRELGENLFEFMTLFLLL